MESPEELTYLILVVIYGIDLKASETINSLVLSHSCLDMARVIIWDNSTISQQLTSIEWATDKIKNYEYIHRPENTPLSRVYNEVIGIYGRGFKYLMLFDQDSNFKPDFFYQLNESIMKFKDVPLFLPIVISSNQIVSPADLFMFKGNYWRSRKTGLIESKYKAAINSGMVISFEYLVNHFVGYDERLKFYGTDTFFMKMYSKDNDFFCVFNTEVQHHLAYNDGSNVEGIVRRHSENMRAVYLLNCDTLLIGTLTSLYLIVFSIKQSIKYRDARFLRW